jgi:hypothetical protein
VESPAKRDTWQIYGLAVESDFAFPFPRADREQIDLTLLDEGILIPPISPLPRRTPLDWQAVPDGWALNYTFDTGETLRFGFDSSGATLRMRHTLAERQDALLLLLGMGFASALYLRQIPILHAAAVVADGSAILLLGSSGAGKSTLAGVLASLGCPYLCDDLAPLAVDGSLRVIPGHPWLKVDPAASRLLGVAEADLHPVFRGFPGYAERWVDTHRLAGGFAGKPAPVRAIYLLDGRSQEPIETAFTSLSPGRACLELTRHLYGPWLPRQSEDVLQFCSLVARQVPVRRVRVPDGLDRLPRFGRALLADAASLSRRS